MISRKFLRFLTVVLGVSAFVQRTLEALFNAATQAIPLTVGAQYCLGRQMSAQTDQEKLQLVRNLDRRIGGQCATSRVQET